MNDFWNNAIRWSEVWAILIPLVVIIRHRIKTPEMLPVILYVYIASVLNIIATVIAEFRADMPSFLQSNLILYNIHSAVRVVLFSWFIINTGLLKPFRFLRFILPIYAVLVLINFIFLESPLLLSTNLYAAESIILIILCVSFFLYSIKDDSNIIWMEHPAFLICSGVSLYEAISFLIFLFFDTISQRNQTFGKITMIIFSISYIILCILFAVALYRNKKRQTKVL